MPTCTGEMTIVLEKFCWTLKLFDGICTVSKRVPILGTGSLYRELFTFWVLIGLQCFLMDIIDINVLDYILQKNKNHALQVMLRGAKSLFPLTNLGFCLKGIVHNFFYF